MSVYLFTMTSCVYDIAKLLFKKHTRHNANTLFSVMLLLLLFMLVLLLLLLQGGGGGGGEEAYLEVEYVAAPPHQHQVSQSAISQSVS